MFRKIYLQLKQKFLYLTISRNRLFDRKYYLAQNPDVARSGMDPVEHYICFGWREQRNPSTLFNTKYYLDTYTDVKSSGMNPLYHYLRFGKSEKRDVLPYPGYSISQTKLLDMIRKYNAQKARRKARVVVYTAIIGGYDDFAEPEYVTDDWDYVCFSDIDIPGGHIYEIHRPDCVYADPARVVRYLKTQPHKLFQDYEYSVWIDANIKIRGPHLERCVKDCMKRDVKYMGLPHPEKREGIFAELAACINLNKDDLYIMTAQVMRYVDEGFPRTSQMLAGGLLIRKHCDAAIVNLGESWWSEIVKGSLRDQLSLNYVLWKHGLKYEILPGVENIRKHSDFSMVPHKKTCALIANKHIKVNYFDLGLCDGEEMEWMTDSILPSLQISNYRAYGFEPFPAFYDKLKSKFAHNDKITLIKKAVADKNGTTNLYLSWQSKEGHSIFESKFNVAKNNFEQVECAAFSDWLKENVPDFAESFNILRFNIEGAEWYLMNDLASHDMIKNIDVFCGHGDDVKKIGEYKDRVNEYYELLKRHNVKIQLFCSIHPETQEPLKQLIQSKLALKAKKQKDKMRRADAGTAI